MTLRSAPDPARYAAPVQAACLHLTVWDAQWEGRAVYLYGAIGLTGAGAQIEAAIRQRFARCSTATWLYAQLAELLKQFAFDGSDAAYRALWAGHRRLLRILARHRRSGTSWPGMSQLEALGLVLVDLHGWQAFTRVVDDVAQALGPAQGPADVSCWYPHWFTDAAAHKVGPVRAAAHLAGSKLMDFGWDPATAQRGGGSDAVRRRRARVEALRNAPVPDREAALEALRTGQVAEGLKWLAPHYRRSDDPLIDQAVRAQPVRRHDRQWHEVYSALHDLYAVKGRRLPASDIVEYTYRETLCSFCRDCIVRLIHRKGRLTNELVLEVCWDSCDELAQFARRVARGRGLAFDDAPRAGR
ncbi:MAG: hypothetical protein LBR19_01375 [Bifidobacteriaceae bacterium]|nr:hypothetical protein [Bifidobacteriaceae bacterium]